MQPANEKRRIELHRGDCNETLPKLLATRPIGDREATFCLLDQRTFECSWALVRSLADYKTEHHKIELCEEMMSTARTARAAAEDGRS